VTAAEGRQVKSIELSPTATSARVMIDIDKDLKPGRHAARSSPRACSEVSTSGSSPRLEMLSDNGEIAYTQSAVVIERLIGRVIQSLGNSTGGESKPSSESGGGG
jgi:hypothetical protein